MPTARPSSHLVRRIYIMENTIENSSFNLALRVSGSYGRTIGWRGLIPLGQSWARITAVRIGSWGVARETSRAARNGCRSWCGEVWLAPSDAHWRIRRVDTVSSRVPCSGGNVPCVHQPAAAADRRVRGAADRRHQRVEKASGNGAARAAVAKCPSVRCCRPVSPGQ